LHEKTEIAFSPSLPFLAPLSCSCSQSAKKEEAFKGAGQTEGSIFFHMLFLSFSLLFSFFLSLHFTSSFLLFFLGVVIWRVEKFGVKAWDKKAYGSFYLGDAYICLYSYKKSKDSEAVCVCLLFLSFLL
jgi:hypothetical protein